ncbi:MAG: hypothetical protein R3B97_07735 [Dehalococcoidia bacterium]|nr:hypothetical protein [Dehalococcoidia bacterium]
MNAIWSPRPSPGRLIAAGLLAVFVMSFGIARAANPAEGDSTWNGCSFHGYSIIQSGPHNNIAATWKNSGTCSYTFVVDGWFWGSDSAWHSYHNEAYAPGTNQGPAVLYNYWTNSIYGYHYLKNGGSQSGPMETHAYP